MYIKGAIWGSVERTRGTGAQMTIRNTVKTRGRGNDQGDPKAMTMGNNGNDQG